jgi:hypothetical protein
MHIDVPPQGNIPLLPLRSILDDGHDHGPHA